MYPLLSRGRRALAAVALAALGYAALEPTLLGVLVGLGSFLGGLPARTALLRVRQLGPAGADLALAALEADDAPSRFLACDLLGAWRVRAAARPLAELWRRAGRSAEARAAHFALRRVTGRPYEAAEFSPAALAAAHEAAGRLGGAGDAAAADELVARGLPAVPAVLEALGAARPEAPRVRASALRCLARIGSGYAAQDALVHLAATDPEVRQAAVDAAAALGHEAAPAARQGLDDRRHWVVLASAAVLARVDPDGGARSVKAALARTESLGAPRRAELYQALGVLGSPVGFEPLARALEHEPEARGRVAAVEALARLAVEAVPERLARAARDPDPAVRAAALRALRGNGTPAATRALIDRYLGGYLPSADEALVEDLLRRRPPPTGGGR